MAGEFYRPVASPKSRAPRLREVEPSGSPARVPRDIAEKDAGEREQDPFLRARRRVPVRRGLVPKSRAGRIIFATCVLLGLAVLVALGVVVRNFLRDDPRFRINSGSNIQILGISHLSRRELLSVFGSDIGRNVFFVPLRERRADLERLPWVGHATVMRLLPNQLRISIVERVPVAFLRSGASIGLVDADGVLLSMSPGMMAAKHYSFPVVTGITAQDPLPVRAARMRLYQQFINDLDAGGTKVSEQLSEVDITDPEDIRALFPAQGSDILVHFGDGQFLHRYSLYQQHLADWRRQYPRLASVDMRFDNQVVLEMAKGSGASGDSEPQARSSITVTNGSAPAQRQSKPPAKHARSKKSAAATTNHSSHRNPARSQQ